MSHSQILLCIALSGFLEPIAQALPQGAENQTSAAQQANIIFAGTVSEVGATSFADVPKSPQTIVVRVESVLKKPAAVSLKKGDNVTVEVKDPGSFQPGMQATFYTDGWIFGSGVAVKELSHAMNTTAGKSRNAAADQKTVGQIERQVSDEELKQRIASADFVVIARVTDIRPWTAPEVANVPRRVTEHDPDWHDAVIRIESILKGPKLKKKELVVRFPQCNDVAWAHSPKFEKGQEGIFFLTKDETSGAPVALLEGTEVNAYTCLRPGDWLPRSDEKHVRSLLKK